jgi:hypothetical protein
MKGLSFVDNKKSNIFMLVKQVARSTQHDMIRGLLSVEQSLNQQKF